MYNGEFIFISIRFYYFLKNNLILCLNALFVVLVQDTSSLGWRDGLERKNFRCKSIDCIASVELWVSECILYYSSRTRLVSSH